MWALTVALVSLATLLFEVSYCERITTLQGPTSTCGRPPAGRAGLRPLRLRPHHHRRWWDLAAGRGARDGEYLLDATCPLLLQTSVKLYGIGGHVVLLLTFVFEGWALSGSSPSASAQYISASFRYWRLCRCDFATSLRRANSFAFAR